MAIPSKDTLQGLVVRTTGGWYDVRADGPEARLYRCRVKGSFRLKGIRSTNPVAVGDRVTLLPLPDDGTALITAIAPRRNYIVRRSINLSRQSHILAANVDMAALVVTLAHPLTSTTFIDRFLAAAEAYRVPVSLLFNKVDLYGEDDLRLLAAFIRLYEGLGYTCLTLSAETGEGLEALRTLLSDRVTLLSGHSGVGKSTLLNRLVPEAGARTAALSDAHDAGQHTTTYSEMHDLPSGGALIDTPGIKGFGTFDMERAEVSHYFREIFAESEHCRFRGCTHTHEPGCAVLQAVGERRIAQSRYQSYLSMLDDRDENRYREGY